MYALEHEVYNLLHVLPSIPDLHIPQLVKAAALTAQLRMNIIKNIGIGSSFTEGGQVYHWPPSL